MHTLSFNYLFILKFNEEMENSILQFIQNTFKDAQAINLEKVNSYLFALLELKYYVNDQGGTIP